MTEQKTQALLKDLLTEFPEKEVERYVSYVKKLRSDPKSSFSLSLSQDTFAEYYRRVALEGLVLDGVHVTIQSTGISYDYIALKNKMLLAYPETIMDVSLVYTGDVFNVKKDSGKIEYTHEIANPFNQDEKNITGAYCIIKNKRGEFFTPLSIEEIQKHRKVARGDFIWKAWFKEMALKTIVKKACKLHFSDIYERIINEDNTSNDIDLPVDIEIEWKQEIENITTILELQEYYKQNAGRGKGFSTLVARRKKELTNNV